MKKKILISMMLSFGLILSVGHEAKADELIKAKATGYYYGTRTATGTIPTVGRTIAGATENYGKVCQIWLDDGTGIPKPDLYLGTYIFEDTAGKDSPVRKGWVLDIFMEDYDTCKEFGCKDIVYKIIESEG